MSAMGRLADQRNHVGQLTDGSPLDRDFGSLVSASSHVNVSRAGPAVAGKPGENRPDPWSATPCRYPLRSYHLLTGYTREIRYQCRGF